MKCHHEFPLCGDGCYIGAHRILGRRWFLPQPHHIHNHVHPPTTNLPLFAVNPVVTVPWPHCSPNLLSPRNQPPPPYTVVVVVITIDGTRRILVWWQSQPQPHHHINWVRPHTPPPPQKNSRSHRTCDRKIKLKNDNNTINRRLWWVDRHGEILITYIAVVIGGRGTKVSFVVEWIWRL